MNRKRQEARFAAGGTRKRLALFEARTRSAAEEETQDILAGLRSLGCRADEARRAAEFSKTLHSATLEERMRAALNFLARRSTQGRMSAEEFHAKPER